MIQPVAGSKVTSALATLRQNAPVDVLVTDLHMPNMDGPTLVRQAREQGLASHVLFMSAPESDLGPPSGSVGFLPKPFSPRGLAAAIRQLVDEG